MPFPYRPRHRRQVSWRAGLEKVPSEFGLVYRLTRREHQWRLQRAIPALGGVPPEAIRDCLPAEGQHQRSGNRCSGWLQLQAEVSNRLPVNKNRRFSDFLTPTVPFRCGGGGDRRDLVTAAKLRQKQPWSGLGWSSRMKRLPQKLSRMFLRLVTHEARENIHAARGIQGIHPEFLRQRDDNAHFQEYQASCLGERWPILLSEKDGKWAWLP